VIREALHVLQGEGIVVTKPYCGRSVLSMTPGQARELVVMRASLESYAAYLAAEKLTDEWSEALSLAARRMQATACRNYGDWVDRELAFHSTVWNASGNELLVRQIHQFVVPSYAVSVLELLDLDFNTREVKAIRDTTTQWEETDSIRGHQRLARAITSGDPRNARDAMVMHIMGAPSFREVRRKIFGF
jgi:DNA-binding GntR family transcriptional regulator